MDAAQSANNQRPPHPLYPWLMGASLGTSAAGLYYLAYYFWGWPWALEVAGSIWLAFVGGYPFLSDGAGIVGLFVGAVARGFLQGDDDRPEDVAPEPEPRQSSSLVGGYQLNSWEQFHYDGMMTTIQHAMAAGSLTSTALIPAAFRNWGHWTYWTDCLALNRFCDKANGLTTALPPHVEFTTIIGRLKRGDFIVPDDTGGPAPQPLPHAFRAGLAYSKTTNKAVDDDD